jgi:hypothetical protein
VGREHVVMLETGDVAAFTGSGREPTVVLEGRVGDDSVPHTLLCKQNITNIFITNQSE